MPYLSYITYPKSKNKEIFTVNTDKNKCTNEAIMLLCQDHLTIIDKLDKCQFKVSNNCINDVVKIIGKDLSKMYKLKTISCSQELFKYVTDNGTVEFDSYQGKDYCGWDWKIKNKEAVLVACEQKITI